MDLLVFAAYCLGFFALLVLTQDVHIFPGAFVSKLKLTRRRKKKLPREIKSFFVDSTNGTAIEVWRYQYEDRSELSKYVAIIFHGNGAPVENFIYIQMWLSDLGITSYNFDYRGFGRSSGWPSERGIYDDSDAVWNEVLKREQLDSSKIIVVGISVGSAPAARAAAKYGAKVLLLSSAFTDLKTAVRAQPLVGLLWPFVRYKFSTITYVQQLKETDLLLCASSSDKIIPHTHSQLLASAYSGTGRVQSLSSPIGGHNLVFFTLKEELKAALREFLILNASSVKLGSLPRP